MPLDAHLNQDLHAAFDYHSILTKDLPDTSPIKFSRKTPKAMEQGYARLWDSTRPEGEGCPSSERIIHDIRHVVHVAYPALYEARGVALYHNARSGRRRQELMTDDRMCSRGGSREKAEEYELNDMWIHESVSHLQGQSLIRSANRFRNLPPNSNNFQDGIKKNKIRT